MESPAMNNGHFALNVSDPVAAAAWCVEHHGLRVLRSLSEAPFTRFLADTSGRVVIEVDRHTEAPVPETRRWARWASTSRSRPTTSAARLLGCWPQEAAEPEAWQSCRPATREFFRKPRIGVGPIGTPPE